MGGMGSGRQWHYGAKDTTDVYRSIDVRHWKRIGLLKVDLDFRWDWLRNDEVIASIDVFTEKNRIIITYRHQTNGGNWQDESYPIYLDYTTNNFGGERPWFLCPARGCSRRVALLYGGAIFACRHCHNLAYRSQRETSHERAVKRAGRIRDKLDWNTGQKPKGMHWKTFYRLEEKHNALVKKSSIMLTTISKKFFNLN